MLYLMMVVGRAVAAPTGDPITRAKALDADLDVAYQERDWIRGEALIREQLTLLAEVEGPHPAVAEAWNNLGFFTESQGKRQEAVRHYRAALSVAEVIEPGAPTLLDQILYNLADELESLEGYEAAIPYWERDLAVCREIGVGTEAWQFAVERLGTALFESGQTIRALRVFEEAERQVTDLAFSSVRASLERRLARVHKDLGDYDAARPWYERALARVETVAPGTDENAFALNDLAVLEYQARNLDVARELLQRAERIYHALPEPPAYDLASTLLNLAVIEQETGEYQESERRYLELLAIRESLADPLELSRALHSYGTLLKHSERYDESRSALERALEIRRHKLPENHPDLIRTLVNLASLERLAGHPERATEHALAALEGAEAQLDALSLTQSDRQRLALRRVFRQALDGAILSVRSGDSQSTLLSAIVRDRDRSARLLRMRREALFDGDDASPLRLQLQSIASELAATTLSGGNEETVQRLALEKDRVEREIMARAEGSQVVRRFEMGDICQHLPENTLAVEVARHEWFDADRSEWVKGYTAWTLDRGCEVHRVELGLADDVDEAVVAARARIQSGAPSLRGLVEDTENTDSRHTLEQLFVRPLIDLAPERTRWVLALDGALATVPISALEVDGAFVAESHEVIYVPTLGVLLDPPTAAPASGALVVGGVTYGGAPGSAATRGAARGASCAPQAFASLPGTVSEAVEVSERMNRMVGREHVDLLSGSEATERAVADAMHGRRVIHLATHGFFARSGCSTGAEWSPMSRSGLVFAGANQHSSLTDADGLLTAEEVALLDLEGTSLVVLSACETGLGEVVDGEGVLGLRRAFDIAGVESIVFSLWPVDDQATAQLMKDFHRVFAKTEDAATALHEAQRRALRRQRRDGTSGDASTWGAFVVSSSR